MIIAYAESASCHCDKQGITFGPKITANYESAVNSNRTKNFGSEVKRRFVIGAYVTNQNNFAQMFQYAQKVRTVLINEVRKILKHGILLLPGASSFAPLISDVMTKKFQATIADDLLQIANFCGLPSITIPFYKNREKA
jgi:aspartyl-tRNA(Asn)/glutamyl-tRNA(Gln) amidotransferase subunit A